MAESVQLARNHSEKIHSTLLDVNCWPEGVTRRDQLYEELKCSIEQVLFTYNIYRTRFSRWFVISKFH